MSEAGARFWAEQNRRREVGRDEQRRRQARRVGAVGFLTASALPPLLWGRVIVDVASEFRLELAYLVSGWAPWALIAAGLLFLVPVTVSAGLDPESRWYPRSRNAYAGWGVTLYLLGCGLATQVAQINGSIAAP